MSQVLASKDALQRCCLIGQSYISKSSLLSFNLIPTFLSPIHPQYSPIEEISNEIMPLTAMAKPNEIDEPFSKLVLDPSSPPLPLLTKPKKSTLRNLFTLKSPPPLQITPLPYNPLRQNEIRLVNLHAGPPSTPITLTTEPIPLSSAEYTALSYVWGDPSDTLPLHVDNHLFRATRNLHSALQHIRLFLKPSQLVPLWIDAISINQADTVERSQQVSQMRQIYTSADLVLTWLGPDLAPGLTYLRELGDHALAVSQNRIEPPKLLPSHVKDRYTTIRETVKVFQCTYWNRVWTVQEYTAPTDLGVFLSGTAWVDRTAFLPATILYTQALHWLTDGLRRRGADASFVDATLARVKKVVHDLKMSYARMAASNERDGSSDGVKISSEAGLTRRVGSKHEGIPTVSRFNLISLLLRFRDLQATDPRDRIYAPLNLLDNGIGKDLHIPVDYSLTVQQLYTCVAKCLLEDEDYWPLSILEICRLESSNLPSWVPDWQVLPRKVLSRDVTTGEQNFCASKRYPVDTKLWRVLDDTRLQIIAVQVDVVVEAWEAFDALSVPRTKSYPTYTLKNPFEKYVIGGQTVLEAFHGLAGIESRSEDGEEVEIYRQEDWHRNPGMMSRFDRRRLIRTENGLAGLAPAEAVQGDKIWLVPGANMFYIFRPLADDGSHALIGELYLQGLMHGEAREFLGDAGTQTVITLV